MSFGFGWPQLIWLCIAAGTVVNEMCHHGDVKLKSYDGFCSFIGFIISGLLLYWGGFFG